jgi:separase
MFAAAQSRFSTTVLANLWDITDKDIDRLSVALFEDWGLGSSNVSTNVSLCNSLTRARDACRMKFLVGSAPVIYGIPAFLR